MNTLSKIGLLVAFLITVGYIIMLSGVSPTFQPRRTPPPETFSVADFQPLPDIQSTEHMGVIDLSRFGEPFHPGFIPDLGVAYVAISTGDYSGFYLFFDRQGTEIGQIDRTGVTFPMGNTFVEIDGYYTVTPNSVSTLTPYTEINARAPISFEDLKTLHDQATLHRSISFSDVPEGRIERTDKLTTHVFLINSTWTVATTGSTEYLEWKTAPFPEFVTQYRFPPKGASDVQDTTYGDSSFFGGKYTVAQVWFDQQEYFRRRAASIGSTTGQGRPEHWRGIGYYEVTAGENSIGFSIPDDMQVVSGSGRFTMKVLGHETLDFVLLERYVYPKTKIYLFKPKRD